MLTLFLAFFSLGWVSFGGPAAHIGYFRQAFVEQRQWVTAEEYAQLIALSQFLPGPGSSQIGFAIGYQRAGVLGGICAFLGFTLPSIILMVIAASASAFFFKHDIFEGITHGLKLLAVVVVADATLSMYRNFCQTKITAAFCVLTACTTLLFPSVISQLLCLIITAILGSLWLRKAPYPPQSKPNQAHFVANYSIIQWTAGVLFLTLFLILPWFTSFNTTIQLFSEFFQTGSLVFGGGHVVLPLLQNSLNNQISSEQFLTGYAAAQAVPGPMFTIATYLGYFLLPSSPIFGAIIATTAIFLPGFLLIIVFFNHWQTLAKKPVLSSAICGINAAVVGLLMATLYQPVFVTSVTQTLDIIWVILGLFSLRMLKLPIVFLVMAFIFVSLLFSTIL
ncbi:chromate efflux transporter [Vibrio casei]|uniref:Chorismate-binding protein n=1 Tax=Vibrio casei TaxID=673372 RepID=A0A368LPK1_9VIBR|nr:chromate efflux transporter [Vibrio casei]RCS73741.1 chorismate-binding protein [Vibrio casei]SJN34672.1 Chromate transport protein ChrA [Vibrio casei]